MANYAGGLIVCRKAVEAMGDEAFAAHPVGTGPFMFAGNIDGNVVRLASNEQYFRGSPMLDGVDIHYIPSFSSRAQALKDGYLDVIFGSEKADWFEASKSDSSIQVDVFGVGQVVTIHFNTSVKPLDDKRIRKAIVNAINRDVFRSLFAAGVVENTYSPVPADFLPGGLSQQEVTGLGLDYAYDPERAKALLQDAGQRDGFTLKLVSSMRDHYLINYESLRDQLAPFDIRIELEVVEHRDMHKRIRNNENSIVIYVAWRPNADTFLTPLFPLGFNRADRQQPGYQLFPL